MSIGIPPRVGGPAVAPEPQPEAAPEKTQPEKREPSDAMDRGARAPKPQASPPRSSALPAGDGGATSTEAFAEAFSALAGRLGEVPDDARVATALEATLPMFD